MKTEYGQNKLVVSAQVQEIVNLPSVKGTCLLRIQEFYENLSKNYEALVTMGKGDMLRIETKDGFKVKPGEPIVEGTTFGGIIYGGDPVQMDACSPEKQVIMSDCIV